MASIIDSEARTESRVIGTLLTHKPAPGSLAMVLLTFFIMAVVSQAYWLNLGGVAEWLPANKEAVIENGEWWRVFTAIFIHADLGHFLSNMYMLVIFVYFVYGYFGRLIYPIVSYILAALVNGIAILTYPPQVNLLGASGLVYLLAGIWLTLFVLIQRQYKLTHRLLRVTGVGLVVLFPSTFKPSVSYRTHAIGFSVGILVATVFFLKNRKKMRSQETVKIDYFVDE